MNRKITTNKILPGYRNAKRKAKGKSGFTLTELLACLMLTAFVFGMAFVVTSTSSTTYAAEATKTQAEIFLSQNVAKISHMLRYADMDIGIVTEANEAKPYIIEGLSVKVSKTMPLFCTRSENGFTGMFVNNGETGEIDFLNTETGDETSVINNASDYKLRAEIEFFDGNESDYERDSVPEGLNSGTGKKQFDFVIRVYAENFKDENKGAPVCESHQIIIPIEENLK